MTSEPKFTPGPWRRGKDFDGSYNGEIIGPLDTPYQNDVIADWVKECDAHLIAAAPDLYAALEGLAIAYKALSEMTGHTFHQDDCSRYQIAIAALAKALGETK